MIGGDRFDRIAQLGYRSSLMRGDIDCESLVPSLATLHSTLLFGEQGCNVVLFSVF